MSEPDQPNKIAKNSTLTPNRAPSTADALNLEDWIAEAKSGALSWSELAERLLQLEHTHGSDHQPDADRQRRCGFGEVIFGSGKSPESIVAIANALLDSGQDEVLVTRVEPDQIPVLNKPFPDLRHDPSGRTVRLARGPIAGVRPSPSPALRSVLPNISVTVVTAGSTDRPVAQEALETLRWMSVDAQLVCDVGVAGPYRLLAHIGPLRQSSVIVVVAGMEGALASVLGGLVACPVIAVPTSVGYGANFEGITTLLSMLSSCAASVTAVNIDAGFKGGYVAGLIAHQIATNRVNAK